MVDDYAWLRERDDPAVLAHLEAENTYTQAVLAPQAELRERVYREIMGRIQETDLSVPARKDGYWYFSRSEEGAQYPIHCRARSASGDGEELLLDCNALAEGQEYLDLGALEVSPDHRLLAYSVDRCGDERFEMCFRDLERGAELADRIPLTCYGAAWSRDSKTLFYTVPDDAMRPFQLWRHELGSDSATDTLVFQEDDERFFLHVELSRSERLLFLTLESNVTSEVWILDADSPQRAFQLVRARQQGVEYETDHQGERLVVLTTLDAPNGALYEAPLSAPTQWRELVPHREDVRLEELETFESHIVLWQRKGGYSGAHVIPCDGSAPYDLDLPEEVRSVESETNLEHSSTLLRFAYESLETPASVYDHDLDTRQRTLLKREPVLGGYDSSEYESRREWACAPDGTRIPISIVHRRGLPRDGRAPALLYGYGAYEESTDPWFSAARLSLLERGFVFAIAHVRGGGELGRSWYEDGKLGNKRHSFTDFIACAEHLVERGICSPHRLAARGGSAGGLLMGAVANLRPELFRAIVAEVPFVDVVNTMLDASLPLTALEWEEWGDPQDGVAYAWMRSYAPIENVSRQPYPAMLVTSAWSDPRVQYWEPTKWVAALRRQTTGQAPILLRTELGAGHGGPSGRYDSWRDEALVLAFLIEALEAA